MRVVDVLEWRARSSLRAAASGWLGSIIILAAFTGSPLEAAIYQSFFLLVGLVLPGMPSFWLDRQRYERAFDRADVGPRPVVDIYAERSFRRLLAGYSAAVIVFLLGAQLIWRPWLPIGWFIGWWLAAGLGHQRLAVWVRGLEADRGRIYYVLPRRWSDPLTLHVAPLLAARAPNGQ